MGAFPRDQEGRTWELYKGDQGDYQQQWNKKSQVNTLMPRM